MRMILAYCVSVVLFMLVPAAVVRSATYYVDYAAGADGNTGDAAPTAFQHSPGDPQAKDKAAVVTLQPGDTVLFKGGVIYRGGVVVQQSGAEGKPIIFDGNTAGGFGTGHAIIDGSEPLVGWKKCASADECDGNPNWKDICWVEVPYAMNDPYLANLHQSDLALDIAQLPRPKYPFPPDPATEYLTFDSNLSGPSYIQDEKNLTQADPHAWDNGLVLLFVPGGMYFRKITAFDPSAHKITFDLYDKGLWSYGQRFHGYTLANAMAALKEPGQYVVRSETGKSRIFLWPPKGGEEKVEGELSGITISRRAKAFELSGQSYVTVQGFMIRKFAGTDNLGSVIQDKANKANAGLVIRDNIITACSRGVINTLGNPIMYFTSQKGTVVEKNIIHDNRGCAGIWFYKGADHVLKDNVIRDYSSAAIVFGKLSSKNCQAIGNTVEDSHGTKSFGILLYSENVEHVLVMGNHFRNTGMTVVIYKAHDVTFASNVFESDKPYSALFMEDGPGKDVRFFNNVVVNAGPGQTRIYAGATYKSAIWKNNIFVDSTEKFDTATGFTIDGSHNLHTNVAGMSKIFADPANHDFHLKKGSPAIGAGVATDIKDDANGTAFPKDKTPDLGAYVDTAGK